MEDPPKEPFATIHFKDGRKVDFNNEDEFGKYVENNPDQFGLLVESEYCEVPTGDGVKKQKKTRYIKLDDSIDNAEVNDLIDLVKKKVDGVIKIL